MYHRQIASLAVLAAVCLAGKAQAQSAIPNYGNYLGKDGLFRIGVQITNGVATREASFQQTTVSNIIDYLDPSQLQTSQGTFYTNQSAVNAVFDLRGAPVIGGYGANSTTLGIRFLNQDGSTLAQGDGAPCQFTYTGQTRQQAFDQFDADTSSPNTPTAKAIIRCLGRSFARNSPVDPLVGNPFSLQSSLARSGLDLTNGDSLVEQQANGGNTAGDPWIIGASYSGGTAGRFDMSRMDGRVARGFHILEGSRALLKFDLPFSYSRVRGAQAYTGQIGLGLEVPVIARRWSLEPRAAYGITYSGDQGSIGHIAQGTVTSRLLFDAVGRGRVIVGNMVGYSATLATPATDFDLNPGVKDWVFRNGIAYELPLKLRAAGRGASVRASYNYTVYSGDKLYNNNFHEVTLSFGVRGREETARSTRDLIRVNLNTILANHFHAYTAGIGFRF